MRSLNMRKTELEEQGRIQFMRETAQAEIDLETQRLKEREQSLLQEQRKSEQEVEQLRQKVAQLEAEKQMHDFHGMIGKFATSQPA